MSLDALYLTHLLQAKTIGRHLHVFDRLDSTNTYAAELARGGAEEGTVVIADSQSRGRGRLNRSWQSPPGRNIYMSVVLRPRIIPPASPLMTLTAGVAVAEVLAAFCPGSVTLKWPNDVLIRGRKVCGILSEMKLHGTEVDFIVIGIGVNVNMALEEFNETFGVATSLKIELDRELPREDLTAKLLAGLEKWYLIFTGKGFTLIRDAWIALSDMMGRDVVVHSMDKVEKGRVAGLDEDGALLLSKEKGQMERIIAGDIILREG